MAHKTLIGCLIAIALITVVAFYASAVDFEVVPVLQGVQSLFVSGTGGDSYVTSNGFTWGVDLDDPAGLFSLCYFVSSTLGTPQVAIKYQVAPDQSAGYVDPVDSAGGGIGYLVTDTLRIGDSGYYCIPGDFFPAWNNSMRLFPWGRLVFHGLGTNPTDTYVSNVWLIRY